MGILFLVTCLCIGGSLIAQESSASASGELSWRPYAAALNNNSPLNPDNYLNWQSVGNQAEASLWFDFYLGSWIQLSGNYKLQVHNKRSQRLMEASEGENYSTLGDLSLGFDQLYLEWTLPNYWSLGYGKYPVRFGYSPIYTPFNYTARAVDFQDSRGQWNAWFKGHAGLINFAFHYFPTIRFRDEVNERTEAEVFFADMETILERQTFAAKVSGFFFDRLDVSILAFLQDKDGTAFQSFYQAVGSGLSWSISDQWIWRAEFLYGNGYDDTKTLVAKDYGGIPSAALLPQWDYADPDMDAYHGKFLTGFSFTLFNSIEVISEYFYNGAGLVATSREDFMNALTDSGDALSNPDPSLQSAHKGFLGGGFNNWKVYELGQHYAFLQLRKFNLFQRIDIINTSILLVDDLSYLNSTSLVYHFNDNFSIESELLFFLFKDNGAYSLAPENFMCEMNVKYSF